MTRDPLALRSESVAEFTFKAIAAGVVLGVLFGAANAYLGHRQWCGPDQPVPAWRCRGHCAALRHHGACSHPAQPGERP